MEAVSGKDSSYTALVDSDQPKARRRPCAYISGILLLVGVACVWVGSSQLVAAVFHDLSFNKPYFLTYSSTCGFTVWLLSPCCCAQVADDSDSVHGSQPTSRSKKRSAFAAVRPYAKVAVVLCPGYMLANYLSNLSLDDTSVASNSVLTTTSSFWTMLFSFCILGEKINPLKVVAVTMTIGGASIMAMSDERQGRRQSSSSHFLGDLLAIGAACLQGIYSVLLTKLTVKETQDDLSMPTIFGFVGLFVLLTGWPVLVVLHVLRVEYFEWPPLCIWGILIMNVAIGGNLSDILWGKALQMTSPLVANLGLSLTIPLGIVSDIMMHGRAFPAVYLGGATLILLGFLLGAGAEMLWQRLKEGIRASRVVWTS